MPTARQLSAAVKVSARCRGQSGTSPTTHGRLRPLRLSSFLTRAAWSISDLYSRSATCQRAHATARAPVAFRKVALEAPLAGRKAGPGLLYDKIVRKSWAERSRQSGVEHFNIEEASKGLDASSLRAAENEFDRAAKVARACRGRRASCVTVAFAGAGAGRPGHARGQRPRQWPRRAEQGRGGDALFAFRCVLAQRRLGPIYVEDRRVGQLEEAGAGRAAHAAPAREMGQEIGERLTSPIRGALAMIARSRRSLRGRARGRRCCR